MSNKLFSLKKQTNGNQVQNNLPLGETNGAIKIHNIYATHFWQANNAEGLLDFHENVRRILTNPYTIDNSCMPGGSPRGSVTTRMPQTWFIDLSLPTWITEEKRDRLSCSRSVDVLRSHEDLSLSSHFITKLKADAKGPTILLYKWWGGGVEHLIVHPQLCLTPPLRWSLACL